MNFKTVTYKGIEYQCRETSFGDIAPLSLEEFILDRVYNPCGEEERNIDDSIVYYADPIEMQLSDRELYALIYDGEEMPEEEEEDNEN